MQVSELLLSKRAKMLDLAAARGAHNLRVFGSAARGAAREDSDVDLLVDLDPGRSALDLAGLTLDLEELLGRRVDIVTEAGLHWFIRDRVLREAQVL